MSEKGVNLQTGLVPETNFTPWQNFPLSDELVKIVRYTPPGIRLSVIDCSQPSEATGLLRP